MKVTSSCNISKTLTAKDMDMVIGCQSEGNIKEHPLLASSESEDSICQLIEVKKRKVLSWPFLIKRLTSLSDFTGPLEPELKATLFDQPLSAICGEDHTLPRPIQGILTILCRQGPSTEGIFRKAANEKARKELKEELNSGGAVDLEGCPVHLLAAVFKDFLRSIPQKLLYRDLFEDWMDALARPCEEDRVEALQQVADKLPRANLELLKQLVYVLFLISKNAGTNKMDSSNLAICIGPNMLAPDSGQSLSLEAQRDLNYKVKTLVEFLIDHCFQVFGENIPAPSSITSDESLEHTDSSDGSTLQNDSAYDSTDPDVEPSVVTCSRSGQPQGPTERPSSLDNSGPRDLCEPGPKPMASVVARLKGSLVQPDRRHSEPSRASSQECLGGRITSQKLTKSEDNFPQARVGSRFESEDAGDPFPEEVFPVAEVKPQRPLGLKAKSVTQGPAFPRGLLPKAISSGSLDSSSDGSPVVSPSSPKRHFFTRHQSFTTKPDKGKPSREIRKHSMSFSFAPHKRAQAKGAGGGSGTHKGLPASQGKKSGKKDSQLAGRIIQASWPETHSHTALHLDLRAQGFSVDDVFRQVDQRLPGRPPSYEEAVLGQPLELTAYTSQTVGSMRARMLSQDSTQPALHPTHHAGDSGNPCHPGPPSGHRLSPVTGRWKGGRTVCASVETEADVAVPGRAALPRLRTVSESLEKSRRDYFVRRCSQPVLEADRFPSARESYI
ncbi:T-cell activation Rho GTPase-activating protein [Echinops telfairi]|uniref:T-cell activation Rho GTPase-activating protein n=1 Tax=Echinops telfairi TaxID=9371 RepID=A0ABM0IKB1_ECHTE|nr:T-cell activation Rho GTPase-activating protein [Echinops telfairi]